MNRNCAYCDNQLINSDTSFCNEDCKNAYWGNSENKEIDPIKRIQKRCKELAIEARQYKLKQSGKNIEEFNNSSLFATKGVKTK